MTLFVPTHCRAAVAGLGTGPKRDVKETKVRWLTL